MPAFVLGAVAVVAALARVTYRQRAVAMVVLGILSATLGFWGPGPATGITVGGEGWAVLRLLAATVLPAALLFRARYRAFTGARLILGAAFASALPFLGVAVFRLLPMSFGIVETGICLAVVAIIASLSGFMGANTTGAGTFMGLAVIGSLAVELVGESLAAPGALESVATIAAGLTAALVFAGIAAGDLPRLLPSPGLALHAGCPAHRRAPSRPQEGAAAAPSVRQRLGDAELDR